MSTEETIYLRKAKQVGLSSCLLSKVGEGVLHIIYSGYCQADSITWFEI